MENSPKLYSPFLPLQLMVIILGVWIIYQVYMLNLQRVYTEAQIQQATPQAESAMAAKKRLLDLAQDVGQLSARDANAAQIVKEFDIRLQMPSSSAPASPAK
jgi:hypothetical protein